MKHIALAAAFALSQLAAGAAFAQTAANPGAASGAMQKEASPTPTPKSTKSRDAVKADRDTGSGMSAGDAGSAPMKRSKSRTSSKGASAAGDARLHGGDNPPAR